VMWWLTRRTSNEVQGPAYGSGTSQPRPAAVRSRHVEDVLPLGNLLEQVPVADARDARTVVADHILPPVRPITWNFAVFEAIEWRRFEAVVEALFEQAGFQTKSQSHGADEGVDIWLYSRSQPGSPVSIVQCKHWQGRRVGVDKIRELRGVMAAHDIQRGQFATTSTFTADAVEFAKQNGINLLDVSGLLGLIAKRTPEQQNSLLAVALEGEYWRPTCVNCGIKMTERKPRNGGSAFWGCTHFPKCKTTMPMKGPRATVAA
jgi:restriction system protein